MLCTAEWSPAIPGNQGKKKKKIKKQKESNFTERIWTIRPRDNPKYFLICFFSSFFFPPLPAFHHTTAWKTSKITRMKAAMPGGGTISNLPAAHSWTLSHLKVLGEIYSTVYSFHNNVRNNCHGMRIELFVTSHWRRSFIRGHQGWNWTGGPMARPLPKHAFTRRSLWSPHLWPELLFVSSDFHGL